jgi:hypothetical protein
MADIYQGAGSNRTTRYKEMLDGSQVYQAEVVYTVGAGGGGGGGAVTVADGADVAQGATTDAPASADTGTFSIVAILKRLVGKFPISLGSKTGAASLSIVPASDALFTLTPQTLPPGTSRSGTIAAANTAQTLAPANASRQSLTGQAPASAQIGINEMGGTAAIGSPDTYIIAAGQAFGISTNRAISIVCGTAGVSWSATET